MPDGGAGAAEDISQCAQGDGVERISGVQGHGRKGEGRMGAVASFECRMSSEEGATRAGAVLGTMVGAPALRFGWCSQSLKHPFPAPLPGCLRSFGAFPGVFASLDPRLLYISPPGCASRCDANAGTV
jgi:hypothetical protein